MVRPATRTIAWLALGGSIALLVVGVGLAARRVHERPAAAVTRAEFLERWSTWRTMRIRFEEVTRRDSGADAATATVVIAQRRGDRVVRDGDAISAALDGRLIGCSPPYGDRPPECIDNGPSDPVAALAAEREQFVRATSSAGRQEQRYRLSDLGGGCYRLRHLVEEYRPEYGERTEYCFGRNGLLVRESLVGVELSITTTRRRLSGPSDQDFELPSEVSASPRVVETTTSIAPRGKETGG